MPPTAEAPAALILHVPSLIRALGAVPECHSPRGRRYEQAGALAFAVCGMAAGCRSLYALSTWGHRASPAFLGALGFRRGTTPSVATLFRLFRDVDRAAFESSLDGWARDLGVADRAAGASGSMLGLHGEHLPGVETAARCGSHFAAVPPTAWRVAPFA